MTEVRVVVRARDLKMLHYWLRRWRKRPLAKECRQPLVAGKVKETSKTRQETPSLDDITGWYPGWHEALRGRVW